MFLRIAYRTPVLNETFALIWNDNTPSDKNKNGKNLGLTKSSRGVESTDRISNHFVKDLMVLSDLGILVNLEKD